MDVRQASHGDTSYLAHRFRRSLHHFWRPRPVGFSSGYRRTRRATSFSPPAAGPAAEFNRKAMELGKQMMIPGITFAFLESLLSSFCILGGIQILRRKKAGLTIASGLAFGDFSSKWGDPSLLCMRSTCSKICLPPFPSDRSKILQRKGSSKRLWKT